MAPSIVWDCLPDNGRPLRVLDPMAGSGTTLVSARAKGHQALGCDTDPLALLIARAWCSDIYPDKLSHCARLVLDRARRFAERLSPEEAYPSYTDDETRKFMSFWFDDKNRIQLTALSKCISRVHDSDEKTLLWIAFSRLVITKKSGVSLAMDVSHSRPHRKYQKAPVSPFDKFLQAVDYINRKAPFRNDNIKAAPAIVRKGDARALPFRSNSVDIVITSPPYLNAIDYIRGHKLSLVWMGHSIKSLRLVRSGNIGSERSLYLDETNELMNILKRMGDIDKLDRRHRGMIMRYLDDMSHVISECGRVLRDDGQAVFVIGNSSIRGVYVKNSEALIDLAQKSGFKLSSKTVRPLLESRRYLPPPNSEKSGRKMKNRMREESILRFIVA
jgi:DNA modification methylase